MRDAQAKQNIHNIFEEADKGVLHAHPDRIVSGQQGI
jgi:hypothetical protein